MFLKTIIILISIWVIHKSLQKWILIFMFDYTGELPTWYKQEWSPYLFGYAIGRMPHRAPEFDKED